MRTKYQRWSQKDIDTFIGWYGEEDLSEMANVFALQDAKSVMGTASKLRSYGYDVPHRS